MNDEMKEILADFLAESSEMLESLDQHFVTLETEPNNEELLNEIFRCMHSMKGSAGFLGFTHLVEVAHHGESLLNKLRNGEITVTPAIIDVILESIDLIKLIQADIRETGQDTHVETDMMVNKLVLTLESQSPDDPSGGAGSHESGKPESSESMMSGDAGNVQEGVEDQMAKTEAGEESGGSNAAVLSGSSLTETVLSSDSQSIPPLSEMLKKMQAMTTRSLESAPTLSKSAGSKEEEQSVRVETRRLDNVMNLVGELVLGRNRIMKLGMGLEEKYENEPLVKELSGTLAQLNLVTSDLQLAVMKTRMVPIRKVFGRFPRLVRDLANKLGKQIRLELSGEETEVDKSVADELGDPLVHLVRNSIDHAIESKADRQAAGKPLEGVVRLVASQEGNSIVIRIEDDGRGLQAEKIKSKALSKGLVTESELAGMDVRDAYNLIFLPGFSTADQVSDVSGRGVGMDVVRTNIGRMNGSIELSSEEGKGCLVTIKLPLTVAIIQALLVEVECATFAIPLATVLEAVKVRKDEIKTINGRSVLSLRERILPLVRLAEEFHIPFQDNADEYFIVVVAIGERRLGIVVDRLRAQEEVVIKSLGEFLTDISGVAGATITGDGKVVLILDMADLVQKSGTLSLSGSGALVG